MTYDEYIAETKENCKKVLADCTNRQLENIEYLRRILWEDDKVTGVISGVCSSLKGKFLADVNSVGLDMQNVMAYGPEAIDVVARCLALKHISINELVEEEREKRLRREAESPRKCSARV